jgi:hypothetical protein
MMVVIAKVTRPFLKEPDVLEATTLNMVEKSSPPAEDRDGLMVYGIIHRKRYCGLWQ